MTLYVVVVVVVVVVVFVFIVVVLLLFFVHVLKKNVNRGIAEGIIFMFKKLKSIFDGNRHFDKDETSLNISFINIFVRKNKYIESV